MQTKMKAECKDCIRIGRKRGLVVGMEAAVVRMRVGMSRQEGDGTKSQKEMLAVYPENPNLEQIRV
jgi:hypothetical protein